MSSGHTLGSHTWSHADLTTLDEDGINEGEYLLRLASTSPAHPQNCPKSKMLSSRSSV